MINKERTRRVDVISLDGKRTLRVTDPRSTHGSVLLGYVPVKVTIVKRRRMIDGVRRRVPVELLSDETTAALRDLGVDLAELVEE